MKLLNEHWNGFRSSLSLVDAYKTLYRSLELQIKIVASCSHIASRLRRPHLATAQVWPLLEEPEAHPKTLLLMLCLEKQAAASPAAVFAGGAADPQGWAWAALFTLIYPLWGLVGWAPAGFTSEQRACTVITRVCFRKHLLFLISIHAWENSISSTNLCA